MAKSHRSRNLGILARRFQDFRKKAVVALEYGQEILAHGIAARAPRRTGRLARSVRKTKVKNDHARHRLYCRVYLAAPYALYVEYPTKRTKGQYFVRTTSQIDGPAAVAAMTEILQS